MKRLSIIISIVCLTAVQLSALTLLDNPDTLNKNSLIKIDPFNIRIISPAAGVQFYRDGIVFLSNTRKESRMPENQVSFGRIDTYIVTFNDTTSGKHSAFSHNSLFEVPCEAMTFNNDYSVMYYTRKPSKKEPEKIYRAKYQSVKNGKREWVSDPKPLSICSGRSAYSHPALSANGEMMVFVSNRKESAGGLDLFITRKEGAGWSAPENIGQSINTYGNEFSPFLDQDNNLFFSSDGHQGFGGYDIFVCKYNGNSWEKPVNLTERINSDKDEIAFTLDRTDGISAFFTRKTRSGKSPAQLIRITFSDKSAVKQLTNLSNALQYIAFGKVSSARTETIASATAIQADTARSKPQIPVKKQAQTAKSIAAPSASAPPQTQQKSGQIQAQTTASQETPKPAVTKPSAEPDVVIYRVQFSSTDKPRGSFDITIAGNRYKTYEYLYNGLYRSCAGEFKTRAGAIILQKALKTEGFIDAFVVAFKNGVRSLDPALFK